MKFTMLNRGLSHWRTSIRKIELLIKVNVFVLSLLPMLSTIIVDFSADPRCRAVIRVHARNFVALFPRNVRMPFVAAAKCHVCVDVREWQTIMWGSIGYWHAMYVRGYINESRPRGRILREYETLMDRCVFADGNEWPVAACRFILDERFCRGGDTSKVHRETITTETFRLLFLPFFCAWKMFP